MKTSLELRQKRAALVKQGRDLLDLADKENRDLTGEETSKYESIMADVDKIKGEIDRMERQEDLDREMRDSQGRSATDPRAPGAGEQRDVKVFQTPEYRQAFKSFLLYGAAGLNAEERDLLGKFKADMTEFERRAMAAGTGSAGGYTVPQGFYDQLTDALKFYGGIRQSRATVIRTASGNDLPMPTANDTGNTGALLSENSAATTADPAFGQKILKAYKFTSNTILVSLELMQDSAFDLEAFLALKLGQRIGRAQNTYFTTGTGTSQPQGIVTGATLGKTGVAGQTTSIIYDDLVDLEHSVDPAYRANAQYMCHDSTLKVLKKLKDGYQRPLWLPGITEKAPDTILGYSYVINNDMATMAANAKSLLFGDLSNFIVRDVMDVAIFRIAEKYIESGQVGFIAFARADSGLLDAGMNPVKSYQNSAT